MWAVEAEAEAPGLGGCYKGAEELVGWLGSADGTWAEGPRMALDGLISTIPHVGHLMD